MRPKLHFLTATDWQAQPGSPSQAWDESAEHDESPDPRQAARETSLPTTAESRRLLLEMIRRHEAVRQAARK